jgi:hypothetical protein
VTTEAILNLLWATLCIGALACHFLRDRGLHFKRAVSVLIASIALFPIVSASDDRLILAALLTPAGGQTASLENGHFPKASAFPSSEDPEHGQTAAPCSHFVLPVVAFAIASDQTPELATGSSLTPLGRAPPLSLPAA